MTMVTKSNKCVYELEELINKILELLLFNDANVFVKMSWETILKYL